MVVCDWGSSNLRAYRVAGDGKVQRRYQSACGSKALAGQAGAYAVELRQALSSLEVDEEARIGISGMAGSKLGWQEMPYHATPVSRAEFAAQSHTLADFPNARLYGGVSHDDGDGLPDVMRGEETQIFGALGQYPEATWFCLPGTHSKWVRVADGRIVAFRTFMTGDLFQALAENSIFKEQISSREFHPEGFAFGCELAGKGVDLDDLFKLRSAFVFSRISGESFHSALSGFLVAREIRAMNPPATTIHLCGSPALTTSYARAMTLLGVTSLVIDAESATIRGHLSLLRS